MRPYDIVSWSFAKKWAVLGFLLGLALGIVFGIALAGAFP